MTATTPRARSTDRRYYGVVEAIVEENEGDDEGRIKVRFPWFDGGTVTDWCRVTQLYAGGGYGSLFVPEKGDEVLVSFVHGDMRFPIVLGGLYNGVDKPPTARTGGRDQKIIRTRAGHEVLMDDTSSDTALRITSAGGHVVELDDAGDIRITAAGSGTVTVRANRVVVDSGDVELGSGASEKVVLGDTFAALFDTHVHPVPGVATSGPPAVSATSALSSTVTTA
jgi:uncharacterized protein involved in type VI secretion and phage assembly